MVSMPSEVVRFRIGIRFVNLDFRSEQHRLPESVPESGRASLAWSEFFDSTARVLDYRSKDVVRGKRVSRGLVFKLL